MWEPGQTLADVEKLAILTALKFYQGNKAQTARSLNIAPNTLAAKLDQYNGSINSPEPLKATVEKPKVIHKPKAKA